VETGKTVIAHGGSVYWNAYRNRWVMIAVESFGSTSFLGEVWYAEADAPLGPWVYARKIVTHNKYSFYNPKQHPMFDKENGRIIYFEGTYTTTFSGNDNPTPRYDYNQVMYRLDLEDRRLALPVAIYEVPADRGSTQLSTKAGLTPARAAERRYVVFFAPDRPGIANLPVYEHRDAEGRQTLRVGNAPRSADGTAPEPMFYILPDDPVRPDPTMIRLYEYSAENGGHTYSVHPPGSAGRPASAVRVLGRVWRNPGRLRPW
jgi:hypothetical protein